MSYQMPTLNWNASNYFNYTDFNRAENNTTVTANLLISNGYKCTNNNPVTNRTNVSLDFYTDLNRIENNILNLQVALGYVPTGWITPVTNWTYGMPFDFNTPNRWEQNINLMYLIINNIMTEYKYSGYPSSICGTDSTYL